MVNVGVDSVELLSVPPLTVGAEIVEALRVPPLIIGIDNVGADRNGAFWNTTDPVPVSSVIAAARFAEDGVPRNVATPAPKPEMPDSGAAVAVIVPVPVAASEAPVPTTIAALVFVPPVNELNATEPAATAAH